MFNRFILLILFLSICSSANAAWYNASWTYRVKITIDNTKVPSDLTDFPIYVDLNDLPSGFHTNVKTDGADIRVTKSDGTTEVPREVVFYTAASDTGELHFKASGTLSSSSDTDFYIYYGNSGASDYAEDATYGRENVWNSNYKAVYHLNEAVNTSAGGYLDSTANDNDATGVSMALTEVSGKLSGNAQDFDGSADYLNLSNGASLQITGDITLSAWINTTDTQGAVFDDLGSATFTSWSTWVGGSTNGKLGWFSGIAWRESSGSANGGSWTNIVTTVASNLLKFYINGSVDANSYTVDARSATTDNKAIGVRSDGAVFFYDGLIDEARIAASAFSANWITTEYNNQNSPSTFYAVGTQETDPSGSTFKSRILVF